jgi:hypothetical protein
MAGRDPSDTPLVVVLAGNYREFEFWCREIKISPRDRSVLFASGMHRIQGLGKIRYFTYGSWYMRQDGSELLHYLRYLEGRQ